MIFESHAHYDDEAFDGDREELLGSLRERGIGTVVNVCAAVDGLDDTVRLMEQYPFVYGAIGVHPDEVGGMDAQVLEKIQTLSRHPKAVAIGEIGLDYHWDTESHDTQKKWFCAQMEIARQEKKPFIIHSRDAAEDTLRTMKELRAGDMYGGVIHCFSYSVEIAREYLDMGLYLGIGGVLTFPNGKKLKEVAAYAPLEQILLETDSPYLSPVPNRGKRNSSLNLPYIAKELANIKGITYDQVVDITENNARKLFGL
ncbi:MAG: TatD family hydrolase [Lachnospiraceae bacterium]|jgi:TatD DNase family protein|nr:TatD family hydrolase [Lachnospiraceae bacterium]MCI9390353.1 TatD family hydrolase [Lachnospiraceae bacterium]MCI9471414.1 TatD family hydrolase [Lachnospiraceae bacterium]